MYDFFQNTYGDQDNSIVIDDSDSESSCQMLEDEAAETNEEYFEIIVPDDVDANIRNEATETGYRSEIAPTSVSSEAVPIASNLVNETLDEDGDKAFAMLIVGELRKMTPAAQQDFKLNVTQMMYS